MRRRCRGGRVTRITEHEHLLRAVDDVVNVAETAVHQVVRRAGERDLKRAQSEDFVWRQERARLNVRGERTLFRTGDITELRVRITASPIENTSIWSTLTGTVAIL